MTTDELKEVLDLFKIISMHTEIKQINKNNIDYLFIKGEYICMLTQRQKELLEKFKNIPMEKYFNI